jgi:polyribonucleotide nucleotidyltransferase
VKVFATDGDKARAAIQMIEGITAEAEIGKIYEGKVVQMRDFGVFVQILPNLDGLVHVSELSDGYVERPEDVVKMGDELRVKCIDVDPSGKVRLSRRAVILEERGEVSSDAAGRRRRRAGAGRRTRGRPRRTERGEAGGGGNAGRDRGARRRRARHRPRRREHGRRPSVMAGPGPEPREPHPAGR